MVRKYECVFPIMFCDVKKITNNAGTDIKIDEDGTIYFLIKEEKCYEDRRSSEELIIETVCLEYGKQKSKYRYSSDCELRNILSNEF